MLSSLFPWDRPNESALGHHHLIAAYCFAWGLQLAYLAYVGLKWRSLAKAARNSPDILVELASRESDPEQPLGC